MGENWEEASKLEAWRECRGVLGDGGMLDDVAQDEKRGAMFWPSLGPVALVLKAGCLAKNGIYPKRGQDNCLCFVVALTGVRVATRQGRPWWYRGKMAEVASGSLYPKRAGWQLA